MELGRGWRERCLMGMVSVSQHEKVLEMDDGQKNTTLKSYTSNMSEDEAFNPTCTMGQQQFSGS